MPFLLANWKLVVVATLLLLLGIQSWRLDRCQKGWHDYEVGVKALAQAQEAENKKILAARDNLAKEAINAKDRAISDLSVRYADARKRLRDNPGGGAVSPAGEAPPLASACEPTSQPDRRLAELETALLDALERGDQELVKYRQLWEWVMKIR